MILGIQTELFEDRRSRKILHVKTTGAHYVVPGKKEGFVRFLQTNLINAALLSFILGMYFKNWSPVVYVAVAAAIYLGYLYYFNAKFVPALQILKEKHVPRKEAKTQGSGHLILQAAAFMAVGGGLIYCVCTNQVDGEMMKNAVLACVLVSFAFGVKSLRDAFGRNP